MPAFNQSEFNQSEFNGGPLEAPVDEWRLYDSSGTIMLWKGQTEVPRCLLEPGKTYIIVRFSTVLGSFELRITMPFSGNHIYDSMGG